jgi:hypothetical protein
MTSHLAFVAAVSGDEESTTNTQLTGHGVWLDVGEANQIIRHEPRKRFAVNTESHISNTLFVKSFSPIEMDDSVLADTRLDFPFRLVRHHCDVTLGVTRATRL